MTKEIRYSHVYVKMMAWNRKKPFLLGRLVFVHKTRFELLDPEFVHYDTLYLDQDGKEQHYPLPKKGACLVLVFFIKDGQALMTTIRTDIMQKAAYYEGCVGQMFEFKIVKEEPKPTKERKKASESLAKRGELITETPSARNGSLPSKPEKPLCNCTYVQGTCKLPIDHAGACKPEKPQVFRTTCFNNHTTTSSTLDLYNWKCPKCGAQWKQTNLIKAPGQDPAYVGKSKEKYQSCVEETAQHGLCRHGNKALKGGDCKPLEQVAPSICSHCLRCTTLDFCGVCGKAICQSCADNGIQCR